MSESTGNIPKERCFEYWRNVAPYCYRAQLLAATINLELCTSDETEPMWKRSLRYPVQRLIRSGQDTAENLEILLGPMWPFGVKDTWWSLRVALHESPPPPGSAKSIVNDFMNRGFSPATARPLCFGEEVLFSIEMASRDQAIKDEMLERWDFPALLRGTLATREEQEDETAILNLMDLDVLHREGPNIPDRKGPNVPDRQGINPPHREKPSFTGHSADEKSHREKSSSAGNSADEEDAHDEPDTLPPLKRFPPRTAAFESLLAREAEAEKAAERLRKRKANEKGNLTLKVRKLLTLDSVFKPANRVSHNASACRTKYRLTTWRQ